MSDDSSSQLRPEDRLPHRAPALLVLGVVREEGDELWVRGVLPCGLPTSDGERVSALYGLELAAQASGMWAPQPGRPLAPKRGYLVGIRRAKLVADLPATSPLLVHLKRKGSAGNLNSFACEVALESDPETVLVSGDLSTFSEY